MSELVDSHCHINFEPLDAELDRVLADARSSHVSHMLCVSVNMEDYPQVHKLASTYPNVFASTGVHPNEQDGQDPGTEELLRLAQDSEVVAIGETGLDYFRCSGDMGWQQQRFRNHIRAARECGKPLIIHNRDATSDTLKILKEENADQVGGVMHCFVDDWETAQQAMDLNFYISFSGIVTFNSAKELKEVAKKVPRERMLVETDSPYLAPVPHRGKTNEPAYVHYVAKCLAELREENLDDVCDSTTDNFFTLFRHAQRAN